MPFYSNPLETHPTDEAISVANNKMFSVHQLADSNGNIIDPAGSNEYAIIKLADSTGEPISADNPLSVTLGSENITITGDVNIGTSVSVTSTPEDPVHNHITEVGTSGLLTVPYLPVSVSNFPATQPVSGPLTDAQLRNTAVPVSGSVNIGTMPEVEIKNDANNPIPVTGTFVTTSPVGATDSFGRQRVSNPLTLFDSSHRFTDNNLWNTATTGTASATFNAAQGLVDLTVNNAINAEVIRETTKVFAYQPGKSLLVLNTFVMETAKVGLRQRVGYYGATSGMYLELDNSTLNLVRRSFVSGSLVETRIAQASWNGDKLDGTGPSGITLDISKAQIFWMDIEWLGVGSVRTGFVINGQFILCHTFHHANIITSTYITTASLPLRYEIKNTAGTAGSSTLKQICSTVISEGGYNLNGLQQAVQTPITAPVDLPSPAGTFYPVISIRLKSSPDRLDAIVIMTALSIMGIGNGPQYNWQVRASATTTGGTWTSAGVDSAVEYKIGGTSVSGGRILASGFFSSSQQSSASIDILKEALFKFQLERNGLTGTPYELTLVCATNDAGADVFTSLDWEEVSR